MISAIPGSHAAALSSLFNRPKGLTDVAQTGAVAAPPAPPPGQSLGATAQSVFDAILHASEQAANGSDAPSLDGVVQDVLGGLDTDADGQISRGELTSAFENLAGGGQATENSPMPPTLYESLFAARAGMDGGGTGTARMAAVADRFRDLLAAAA